MPEEDRYTEVTTERWGSRLMASIKGVIVGAVMVVIAFPILWMNEASAVRRFKSLNEGGKQVIAVPAAAINDGNDGKLIHISGDAVTDDQLSDSQFGISTNAIRLIRNVEMYQWDESSQSQTRKELGGKQTTVKTYSYERVWSTSHIDSTRFKKPNEHRNPTNQEFTSQSFVAQNATVGAFSLPPTLIADITKSSPLTVTAADLERLSPTVRARTTLHNGGLYIGRSPSTPEIGDMRVTFQVVKPQTVSIVAQQSGNALRPFATKSGKPIELLSAGNVSADAMFEQAKRSSAAFTWFIRFVGFVVMLFGLYQIFSPIAVLGDVIPVVGNLLGAGLFLCSAVIAGTLSLLTIALSWLIHRPMLSIPLIVLAGAVLLFGIAASRKRAVA